MRKKVIKHVFLVILAVGLALTAATAHAEYANLRWNAPTSGGPVDGYYIYYGQTDDISIMTRTNPITGTSYMLQGLDFEEVYYIYVVAFNVFGEGQPSEVKVVNVNLRVTNP